MLLLLAVNPSIHWAEAAQSNVFLLLVLHYDTYYSGLDKASMHKAFEDAISFAEEAGYRGEAILVTCWRDVLGDVDELEWLLKTLKARGVPTRNLGLFIAPEDAPRLHVIARHVDDYTRLIGFNPLFATGFSMNPASYRLLSGRGVRVILSNLWEEGEDFSFRGLSTGDRIRGANWEGAPHQPYKPSTRSACIPGGLNPSDAIDVWEAHWVFRNPKYAFTVVNSRHMGSIHPNDLLLNQFGSRVSVQNALSKLESILSLVDLNARLNEFVVLSYTVEVSLLRDPDVYEVWRQTLLQFRLRGYRPLNALELVNELVEPLRPMPTYVWIDNSEGVYAMVTSLRCRSIYLENDPFNDTGSPKISFTSYLTGKCFNATFQSVRELAGLRGLTVSINGVNAESRSLTAPEVVAVKGVGVLIRRKAPSLNYASSVYLTASGVLVSVRANTPFEVVQPFNVQSNTPTPFSDSGVLAMTDWPSLYPFLSDNREDLRLGLRVKRVVTLMAPDGYGLSVVLLNYSDAELIDLAGDRGVQLLTVRSQRGEVAYALTPTLNPDEAVELALEVLVYARAIDRAATVENPSTALNGVAAAIAATLTAALIAASLIGLHTRRRGRGG